MHIRSLLNMVTLAVCSLSIPFAAAGQNLPSKCTVAPGTPVWSNPGFPDTRGTFHQPKFGGEGFIGKPNSLVDGYSAMVSWPAQPIMNDSRDYVSAWPGIVLENGYFIQNGYSASTSACSGAVWVEVFGTGVNAGHDVYRVDSPVDGICSGQSVQFKAERDNTTWIFSYRVAGSEHFIEQGRYDIGVIARGKTPILAMAEVYDFNNSSNQLAPISFSAIQGKTGKVWKPVDLVLYADDELSPWLMVRPDAAQVGFMTSVFGDQCYKIGDELFSSRSLDWAKEIQCDNETGLCLP